MEKSENLINAISKNCHDIFMFCHSTIATYSCDENKWCNPYNSNLKSQIEIDVQAEYRNLR